MTDKKANTGTRRGVWGALRRLGMWPQAHSAPSFPVQIGQKHKALPRRRRLSFSEDRVERLRTSPGYITPPPPTAAV